MNFSALGNLWTNPFTSAAGAGVAISAIAHAAGLNLPFVDSSTLTTLFIALGLFGAKDGNVTGGSVKQ